MATPYTITITVPSEGTAFSRYVTYVSEKLFPGCEVRVSCEGGLYRRFMNIATKKKKTKTKNNISPEGRKRIAAAQRKRWKAFHRAKFAAAIKVTRGK